MPERPSAAASRRIVSSASARERSGQVRLTGGLVIAVFGARADVGVTTVATSLAQAFQSLGNVDVALAELDPRVVRARSQGKGNDAADRMTISGASTALVRRGDGVWVLSPARARAPSTGDAKGVTRALEAIRGRFRVSVAELEHQVNERTLAAFDAADRILLVTEGSVPSIRGTQRVLRLCRRLNYPDEKMCVILNRVAAPGSLEVSDVSAALRREIYWKIPNQAVAATVGLAERLLAD